VPCGALSPPTVPMQGDAQNLIGDRRRRCSSAGDRSLRVLRWVLVFVWMGFLAYMSLGRDYPPPIEGALAFTGTASLHFGGYAVLAALLGWAWGRRTRRLLAVAGAFAYGAVLEMLQLLVPGRTAAWDDLGVNLAGAVTGTLILVLAIRVARWARPSRE